MGIEIVGQGDMDSTAAFFARAMEAAGVGGWEYDVRTGTLLWTPVTYRIHDLEPGIMPSLEDAVSFYAPEARPVISEAVRRGIEEGEAWDLELPFITAKGRHIWVRAFGQPIRENGQTVMLTGAFQDVTAHRELLLRLDRLSAVAQEMTNAVIITDRFGRTEWVNPAFERMSGYTLAELKGRAARQLMKGPRTDKTLAKLMADNAARGQGYDVEVQAYSRDGTPFWIAVSATPVRDAAGELTAFMAVASDVTARRQAQEEAARQALERQRAEALLRDVLETLPNAVSAFDEHERLALTNRAHADMLPAEAALASPGIALHDMVRGAAERGQYPDAGATDADRAAWLEAFARRDRNSGQPRTLRLPDGRFVQEQERRSASGNLVRVHTDTTDLKRAEEKLRAQAYRDTLTGLPNRRAFVEAIGGKGAEAPRRFAALALVDVDFFKEINDTLGHDTGDEVLVQFGGRLAGCMRPGDVAARLGGDEFAILLAGRGGPAAIEARMDRIVATLTEPLDIRGRALHVTVSAGVTLIRARETPTQLLKSADLALYEAKKCGRARWAWYRREQAEHLERRTMLSSTLRTALASGAVDVALQPKRLLRGGHLGFEALARWHDGASWRSLSDFAGGEDSSLVVQLGRRVAEAAVARMAELRRRGHAPGRLALNVTGRQLLERGFLDTILALLARHGFDPAELDFEVTEAVIVSHTAGRVEQVLREARGHGIRLVLDNYGTGHAPLSHLLRLPFDRLKIDRSFIAEIDGGPRSGVIARSVIALARSLDIQSVAEGVETQAQLAFLQEEGCDAAQGYLIGRPMLTSQDVVAYLAAQPGAARPPLKLIRTT